MSVAISLVLILAALSAFVVYILSRRPSLDGVDPDVSPLSSWTEIAIELAREQAGPQGVPRIVLHTRDIRSIWRNLRSFTRQANRWRAWAEDADLADEALEFDLMQEKLTGTARMATWYLLVCCVEYMLRSAFSVNVYAGSTAAAMAYGDALLMYEGLAEIVGGVCAAARSQ